MSMPLHGAPDLPISHVSSGVRSLLGYPKGMTTGIWRQRNDPRTQLNVRFGNAPQSVCACGE